MMRASIAPSSSGSCTRSPYVDSTRSTSASGMGDGSGSTGRRVPAEIAAKENRLSCLFDADPRVGRSEQMAGVDELGGDARHHGNRALVADRLQQRHGPVRVFHREERQRRPMPGVALAVGALRVFFLDPRGVSQHDARQVGGRGRAEDPAAKTLPDQPRQVAGVIEVGMRQHDGRDLRRAQGQRLPVALAEILQSLKQPTVDEQPAAADLEQVFRAGDRPRRAEKCQCHSRPFSKCVPQM